MIICCYSSYVIVVLHICLRSVVLLLPSTSWTHFLLFSAHVDTNFCYLPIVGQCLWMRSTIRLELESHLITDDWGNWWIDHPDWSCWCLMDGWPLVICPLIQWTETILAPCIQCTVHTVYVMYIPRGIVFISALL